MSFKPLWEKKWELTAAELELLRLEKEGLSHAEIAFSKGIKPNSVSVMKTKINKKLARNYIPAGV